MRSLPLHVALVALVAVFAWPAQADAASRISVVDLVKVMREHRSAAEIEKAFVDARKQADANLKSAQAQLEALKKNLEQMNEDDPERPMRAKQYQQQLANMKFNYEWAQKSAVRDYARGLERLYKAVRTVIAKYARENGIEIVLVKTDPSQPMLPIDHQDFALKSRLRVVLYADARTDITNAILALVK